MKQINYENTIDFLLAIKQELDDGQILDIDTIENSKGSWCKFSNYDKGISHFCSPEFRKNIPTLPELVRNNLTFVSIIDYVKDHGDKLEKLSKIKGFW